MNRNKSIAEVLVNQQECPTPIQWHATRGYMTRRIESELDIRDAEIAILRTQVAALSKECKAWRDNDHAWYGDHDSEDTESYIDRASRASDRLDAARKATDALNIPEMKE